MQVHKGVTATVGECAVTPIVDDSPATPGGGGGAVVELACLLTTVATGICTGGVRTVGLGLFVCPHTTHTCLARPWCRMGMRVSLAPACAAAADAPPLPSRAGCACELPVRLLPPWYGAGLGYPIPMVLNKVVCMALGTHLDF